MTIKTLALPLSLVLAISGLASAAGSSSASASTPTTLAQAAPVAPAQPGQPGGRMAGPGGPGMRGPESVQQLQARIQALSRQTTDADARALLSSAQRLLAKAGQNPRYLRAAADVLRAAEALSGRGPQPGQMGPAGQGQMGPGGHGPAAPAGDSAPTPPTGK